MEQARRSGQIPTGVGFRKRPEPLKLPMPGLAETEVRHEQPERPGKACRRCPRRRHHGRTRPASKARVQQCRCDLGGPAAGASQEVPSLSFGKAVLPASLARSSGSILLDRPALEKLRRAQWVAAIHGGRPDELEPSLAVDFLRNSCLGL